jgi:hypothetical protein
MGDDAQVHKPGVGAALGKLAAANVDPRRVKVVRMDALWLLRDFIPRASLTDVLQTDEEPDFVHEARSIHWSPYDRVGVVNADP